MITILASTSAARTSGGSEIGIHFKDHDDVVANCEDYLKVTGARK